jgi:hypothetical protein
MSCERCGGLMVIETVCELMEGESRRGTDTTRCLNCGNFEDRIIRTNRVIYRSLKHVEPLIVETRRPTFIQPGALERPVHTDGINAESPRGRAPHLSAGIPSAKTRKLEPAKTEQPT